MKEKMKIFFFSCLVFIIIILFLAISFAPKNQWWGLGDLFRAIFMIIGFFVTLVWFIKKLGLIEN